jgi:hypothetical protein
MCQRLITARPRGLASKTPPSPSLRRAFWQATSFETSAVCAGCGGHLNRPASGTAHVCLLPSEALRGKRRRSATTLVAPRAHGARKAVGPHGLPCAPWAPWALLRAAGPNPSLKRSANGRPPGPGRRYTVHFRQPGPAALPLAPA